MTPPEDVVAYAGESRDGLTAVDPEKVVTQLKTVYDPEIPVDIYELGLIYRLDCKDNGDIDVDMTLTAPACPVAEEIPQWVADAVVKTEGAGKVMVQLVFEPPWTPDRMSDEARLELDMF
ncbi:SUF system Fe-S cluster assembly protein [Minwuia thermotolerans]|uniref:SUF system Fe-S cluster assembly protein n=3 Tax=Minwuia thermotolerans TaxID=2056226 RepID=A0A2M9G7N5_9PROT|nr:SUF system Fe-S cluster assembly protein [Minwuia thermotolerans]